MIDPREVREIGVALEDQVTQRLAREVARCHAVAHVTPCPGKPSGAVETDGGIPVARHAERTAPAMRDRGVACAGKEVVKDSRQLGEDRRVSIEPRPDLRTEVIRRTPSSEGDPIVRGALGVDDEVPTVAHRFAVRPLHVVPERPGKRFGRDDEGVERDETAREPREPRRVSLGRAHDDIGAHKPVFRDKTAGLDLERRCPLVHRDATPEHRAEQPARQPGRLERRAMRRVGGAMHLRRTDPRTRARIVDPLGVVRTEAPAPVVGDVVLQPANVRRRGGKDERSAPTEVAVDPLVDARPVDVVDRQDHLALQRDDAVASARPRRNRTRTREQRRGPAAIAT